MRLRTHDLDLHVVAVLLAIYLFLSTLMYLITGTWALFASASDGSLPIASQAFSVKLSGFMAELELMDSSRGCTRVRTRDVDDDVGCLRVVRTALGKTNPWDGLPVQRVLSPAYPSGVRSREDLPLELQNRIALMFNECVNKPIEFVVWLVSPQRAF